MDGREDDWPCVAVLYNTESSCAVQTSQECVEDISSVVCSLSSPAGALRLLAALTHASASGLESKRGRVRCTRAAPRG